MWRGEPWIVSEISVTRGMMSHSKGDRRNKWRKVKIRNRIDTSPSNYRHHSGRHIPPNNPHIGGMVCHHPGEVKAPR